MAKLPKGPTAEQLKERALRLAQHMLDMPELRENIKTYIINRTLSGYDYDDNPFKPYSTQYANYKKALSLPTKPNISLSGELLRSMDVVEDKSGNINTGNKRYKIVFNENPRSYSSNSGLVTNSKLAEYIIEGTKNIDGSQRMPPRNFVRLTQLDLKAIVDLTNKIGILPRMSIPMAVET